MLRTGCLLAPQRDFVVTLRRSGPPYRRPPATALLGHYAGQTLTGSSHRFRTHTTTASDSLPAPRSTSRLHTGYRTGRSTQFAVRFGRGEPPQFPPSPSKRSRPLTPRSLSRLHFQDLHRFHGLHREPPGSALPQYLTTRQASLPLRTAQLLPPTGFRRWASTRPVSRPSRQPATGPPDSYPDRTLTGRRRRAFDQVMT